MIGYPTADTSSSEANTKRRRIGEPAKFVPVIFVIVTIFVLYSIFVVCHCTPLLQIGAGTVVYGRRWYGVMLLTVFHFITIMIIVCYVRCILVHPGEIPDGDLQWEYTPLDVRAYGIEPVRQPTVGSMALNLQETKRSGDRRHCKWCGKYKPDRCHHCRVCRCCILKMDHHCPWIYNCVGFMNYKYFFLLLFYSALALHIIIWSMASSVVRCVYKDTRFVIMFSILFGETLSIFLGVLITMFWCFHIWLMLKAMTTIEFCEQSLPKKKKSSKPDRAYDSSVYDLGLFGNVKTILGPSPLLALLPLSPPPGDGLHFVSDETRLSKDLEASKGIRRRSHQQTQRSTRRPQRGEGRDDAFVSEASAIGAVHQGIEYGAVDGPLTREP